MQEGMEDSLEIYFSPLKAMLDITERAQANLNFIFADTYFGGRVERIHFKYFPTTHYYEVKVQYKHVTYHYLLERYEVR